MQKSYISLAYNTQKKKKPKLTRKHLLSYAEDQTLSHGPKAVVLDGVDNDSDDRASDKEERDLLDLALRDVPSHVVRDEGVGDS